MKQSIQKAAVLGAGTMGAGIAAHLANSGIPVLLLDIPGKDDRNGPAVEGLKRIQKSKPAAFMHKSFVQRIEVGNLEDDLERLGEVDWVVEAVVERLDIKRDLLEKVEKVVAAHTIVSSNSSGIPMKLQVKGRSPEFAKRFLGTHFFNPPRYMHLLELIPTEQTDPAVVDRMKEFGELVLGKGVVIAHDVPGFAANRVGVYCVANVVRKMEELGLKPHQVDFLTGPLIGKPKSATFRTMDLSGVDVVATVAKNLHEATGEETRLPEFVDRMVSEGRLGEKTRAGFYKKIKNNGKSVILGLNFDTFEYEESEKYRLPDELAPAVKHPDPVKRLEALLDSETVEGRFTRETFFPQIQYAAQKVGEVADSGAAVDNAMKWGFGWEMGPLEMARGLGEERVRKGFEALDLEIPEGLFAENGAAQGPTVLRDLHRRDKVVISNQDASLLDLGDGVACLEFHSKANAIGAKILEMFDQADQEVRRNFTGLVVGNQGQNFCAGADISMILRLAQEQNFEEIRQACRTFQGMTSRLRYSPYPVVATPFGMTLGGGCEVALWADETLAGAELYTGLVEVGVGILPAGGGTTEMLIRMNEGLLPGAQPFVAVQKAFELIAMAKVSSSAFEAQELGLLRPTDHISMGNDRLIDQAKARVLALAPGYRPQIKRQVEVLGETAYANLMAGAYMMKEGQMITEYEYHLAKTIARVLTGGTQNRPVTVSETVLLELEEEAFLSLTGEEKTQQRLAHTLKTGKTLRN